MPFPFFSNPRAVLQGLPSGEWTWFPTLHQRRCVFVPFPFSPLINQCRLNFCQQCCQVSSRVLFSLGVTLPSGSLGGKGLLGPVGVMRVVTPSCLISSVHTSFPSHPTTVQQDPTVPQTSASLQIVSGVLQPAPSPVRPRLSPLAARPVPVCMTVLVNPLPQGKIKGLLHLATSSSTST